VGSIDTSEREQRAYDKNYVLLDGTTVGRTAPTTKSFSYVGDGKQLVGLIWQSADK